MGLYIAIAVQMAFSFEGLLTIVLGIDHPLFAIWLLTYILHWVFIISGTALLCYISRWCAASAARLPRPIVLCTNCFRPTCFGCGGRGQNSFIPDNPNEPPVQNVERQGPVEMPRNRLFIVLEGNPQSGEEDVAEFQNLTMSTAMLTHLCNFMAFMHILVHMLRNRRKRSIMTVSCLVFLYANTLPIAGIRSVLEGAVRALLDSTSFEPRPYNLPSRWRIYALNAFGPIFSRLRNFFIGDVDEMEDHLQAAFADLTNIPSPESTPEEGDGHFQSLSSVAERLAFIKQNWREVYTSDVLYRVRQFIGYIVGYIFSYSNPDVEAPCPKTFTMLGIDGQKASPMTILDCAIGTLELIVKKCEAFSLSGDIRDLYAASHELRELEARIADIEGNMAALELGNYDMTPFGSSEEVLANVEEIIQDLRGRQAGEHQRTARLWYDAKLSKMQELFIRLLKSSTGNAMREAPFAVLLYGASSVGKSTVANQLMKCLLAACGHASTSRHVTVLNLADKFQSDYRPQHSGIILDDIANARADKSEVNHTSMIIDLINNIPKAALQAEVEKKGLVMLTPKIVIGTTNVKDVQASIYSNEPFSIVRRFAYTLTVEVSAEFAHQDGTLDSSKVPEGDAVDVWNIRVERPVGVMAGGKRSFRYEEVLQGSFAEVASLLCEEARAHVRRQRRLVAASSALYETELCVHSLFANLCEECNVDEGDHQSGFLGGYSSISLLSYIINLKPFYNISLYIFFNVCLFKKFFLLILLISLSYFLVTILNSVSIVLVGLFWSQFCHYCLLMYAYRSLRNSVRAVKRRWTFHLSDFHARLCAYRKPIFFLGMTVPVIMALLGLFRVVSGQFQTFSAGEDPEPDENPRENVWQKIHKVPLPVSESARTTTFQALLRMANRAVRLAIVNGSEITHLFPICGDMWVMNAHVWKDKGDHIVMRVVRGDVDANANIQDLVLHKSEVYFIPARDLAFFRFRSAGSVKDFRPWFMEDVELRAMIGVNGRIALRQKDGLSATIDFGQSRVVPKYRIQTAYFENVVVAHVPDGTWHGLCGSPWVADTRAPCLLGIHFAGRDQQGACAYISQKDISCALSALESNTTGIMLQSAGSLVTNTCGREFGPLGDAHHKSPTQFLSERAKIEYFGSHTLPRRTFRSKVQPSLISESVESITGVKNMFGPPKDMNHYRHFQKHLDAVTHTNDYFQPDYLKQAEQDLLGCVDSICDANLEQLLKIKPLSETAVLSGIKGVRGVDRLDQSTSAGWPLNKPKSGWIESLEPATSECNEKLALAPCIRDEVKRIENCALRGERSYAVFRANLKDEPTKLTKDKVRVFAGAPLAHSYLIRKYFLMVIVFIQSFPIDFECAVGTDAHGPQWNDLMIHLRRFGETRGVAGDYKAYDTTISATMLASVYKILYHIIERANSLNSSYSGDDLLVVKSLMTDLCQPCYEHNGDILGVVGSNPSGHNLTVIVNNIANSLYMRYAYYALGDCEGVEPGPFQDNVSLLCYGDDNIMGVSDSVPWFNHTSIAEMLEVSGVVYTMADKEAESVPYVDVGSLSFLKRGCRYESAVQAYLAPLEEGSIFKSLHNRVVNQGSCSAREHAGAAISAASTEFFLHGREVYEKYYPQLLRIVEDHDLSNQVFDVVDYDAKLALYKQKYC
jgi:hypothetical protein